MVPCKSTAEEVSFEWSHHRISLTDSKVRTTLHVFIIDSASERVKLHENNAISTVSPKCATLDFICGFPTEAIVDLTLNQIINYIIIEFGRRKQASIGWILFLALFIKINNK